MNVALYARVSTLNHGQSPDMQIRALKEYCALRGWTITGEYVDIGISGTKEKRPELDLLMADAAKKRFDIVACWRFDRFARSVSHLLRALETFKKLNIEFVSLCEQVDTSTPTGKMIFTVLGAVSELERSLIVERVRAGLAHRKALIAKQGFFVSKEGKRREKLGRDARTDIDVEEIARLRTAGKTWRQIAEITGVPRQTCVRVCPKDLSKVA